MALYYSLQEFKNQKSDNIQDIIEGICPVGVTLLHATQKTGKSLLTRTLMKAICEKKDDVLGHKINKKNNCLYFALDDSESTLHSRFDELSSLDNCYIVTKKNFNEYKKHSGEFTKIGYFNYIIENFIKEKGKLSLVIVDTFEKIRNPESLRDYATEVEEVSLLKAKAEELGYNLFLVHHSTKSSQSYNSSSLEGFYGSNGLGAEVDTIIELKNTVDKNIRSLHIGGNNVQEQELLLSINDNLFFEENKVEKSELLVEDFPEKTFLQIIKFFTRYASKQESKTYFWSGSYAEFITDLDLDLNPASAGKFLNKNKEELKKWNIEFEITRKKKGNKITVNVDCSDSEEM